MICLEIKTPTGRLAPIQAVTLKRIQAAGGIAVVVRSVEEALRACR